MPTTGLVRASIVGSSIAISILPVILLQSKVLAATLLILATTNIILYLIFEYIFPSTNWYVQIPIYLLAGALLGAIAAYSGHFSAGLKNCLSIKNPTKQTFALVFIGMLISLVLNWLNQVFVN